MAHEVSCPKGHRVQITEAHFGRQVQCPTCGETFVAPNPGEQAGAAPNQFAPQPATAGRNPGGAGFAGIAVVVCRPMMAVSLLVVLVARGCDSLDGRSMHRAKAKRVAAENEFNQKWEAKLAEYGGIDTVFVPLLTNPAGQALFISLPMSYRSC